MEDGFVVLDNPSVYVLSLLAQDASNYVYFRLCRGSANTLGIQLNIISFEPKENIYVFNLYLPIQLWISNPYLNGGRA